MPNQALEIERLKAIVEHLEAELELYAEGKRCEGCRLMWARSNLATVHPGFLLCEQCEDCLLYTSDAADEEDR